MRTHNCGVSAGADDDEEALGVGVGVGVLVLGVGEPDGDVESVAGGVDAEVSVGVGVEVSVGVGVEVSVGVGVEVSVGVGVEVSVGETVEVSVGDGVVSVGVSAPDTEFAAVSTTVVGGVAQGALVGASGMVIAFAASAAPNALKPRMVNPAVAPSAARLTISVLTRASLTSVRFQVVHDLASRLLTIFVPVLKAPASVR